MIFQRMEVTQHHMILVIEWYNYSDIWWYVISSVFWRGIWHSKKTLVAPGKTVIELYPSFVDMWVACLVVAKPVGFWDRGRRDKEGEELVRVKTKIFWCLDILMVLALLYVMVLAMKCHFHVWIFWWASRKNQNEHKNLCPCWGYDRFPPFRPFSARAPLSKRGACILYVIWFIDIHCNRIYVYIHIHIIYDIYIYIYHIYTLYMIYHAWYMIWHMIYVDSHPPSTWVSCLPIWDPGTKLRGAMRTIDAVLHFAPAGSSAAPSVGSRWERGKSTEDGALVRWHPVGQWSRSTRDSLWQCQIRWFQHGLGDMDIDHGDFINTCEHLSATGYIVV